MRPAERGRARGGPPLAGPARRPGPARCTPARRPAPAPAAPRRFGAGRPARPPPPGCESVRAARRPRARILVNRFSYPAGPAAGPGRPAATFDELARGAAPAPQPLGSSGSSSASMSGSRPAGRRIYATQSKGRDRWRRQEASAAAKEWRRRRRRGEARGTDGAPAGRAGGEGRQAWAGGAERASGMPALASLQAAERAPTAAPQQQPPLLLQQQLSKLKAAGPAWSWPAAVRRAGRGRRGPGSPCTRT
jgi:hypothetical protein